MVSKDIQITFIGMEPTEAIKNYCIDKISKHRKLWEEATSIEVFLKENVNARGVKHDFRVDINVYLPKTKVRVEQIGEDMYANIDKASDVLARRLKRYHDTKKYWEEEESWKKVETDIINNKEEEESNHYVYIPKIVTRKKIKEIDQMEEIEAIESMELLGYGQLIFKHRRDGKLCMVYKREHGGYGVVELELE